MKNRNRTTLLIALVAIAITLSSSFTYAQLKITEVQSSEIGSGHQDWWELSNFGASAVDLTGYKFDDDSSNLVVNAISLPGLTIQPGESAVFVETLSYSTYTNWWNLNPSVQVGTYTGSGISFGAGGDKLNLWDADGNLVDFVWFGAATAGHTFDVFDDATRQAIHQSADGVFGAYTTTDGNIGSPGSVPEPSTFALGGFGLIALLKWRGKRLK